MVEAGFLGREARVELWRGVLFEKWGKNPPHVTAQSKSMAVLVRAVPPGWYVASEAPVVIGPRSVPYPDLAVFRGEADDDASRCATGADAGLTVEVADSSRAEDLGSAADDYAAGGVARYWVIDLIDHAVVTHSEPRNTRGVVRYGRLERLRPGDTVELSLPDAPPVRIAVADLLPRRT
jgi:Uma2 family endonuclease